MNITPSGQAIASLGHQELSDADGEVVNFAGENFDEWGYGFKVPEGTTYITLSGREIDDMRQAIVQSILFDTPEG